MKWKLTPILRAEAGELPEGGGAAVAEPSAAAPAPALAVLPDPSPAAAAPVSRKPTLLEKITAGMAEKGSLLAQLNDAQGQLATITGQHAALLQEKATLETGLTAKRQELADIEAALNAAHSTAATAEERAVDITASQGVPPVKLPEGAASSTPTIEDLMARLDKEQDPKARFTLAQEIQALRWAN